MKAVVFIEPRRLIVEERPVPEIGSGDVLVKVHACGVCGTDMHIFAGEHIVRFPVVPGHEFSGEIADVGPEVTSVGVGDRVTIDPNIFCHTCSFCADGQVHLCENLTAVGVNYDGGFAEYCRVPASQVYRVPDSVSLDDAAFAEPLACCIHGLDRADLIPGRVAVVLGAGSIGLLMVQLARAAGARVLVSEPDETKRRLASELGASACIDPTSRDVVEEVFQLTDRGADVVIECAGLPRTAETAPKLARRGGTILQFGVVSQHETVRISPYDVFYRELSIVGSFVNPFTHARAVEMLASGAVSVRPLVTHRFGLDEAAKALETASGARAIKVQIAAR